MGIVVPQYTLFALSWMDPIRGIRGVLRNLSRGGGLHFSFPGGAQHRSGPENHLKSIDFSGPGGLSPPP